MGDIRKAYYYGRAVPPKDWLVYASLLWDKIWVGQSIRLVSESYADQMQSDSDGRFLHELLTRTTILDDSIPALDKDSLSQNEVIRFDEYFDNVNHLLETWLAEPAPAKPFDPPTYEQIIQLASLMNQCTTPPWAQGAFRDLDYFFDNSSRFQDAIP